MTEEPTRLVTERLVLRRARPGDLDGLHRVLSNPRAMRYWSRPEHDALEDTRAFLDGMIAMTGTAGDEFIIERDGAVIGKAGMYEPPEIGYILHPDHWGIGLASEALRALVAHLFASHSIPSLTAEIDPRNLASHRVLAKLGFVETGRAERTLLWRDEWCDSIYFALHRPGGA